MPTTFRRRLNEDAEGCCVQECALQSHLTSLWCIKHQVYLAKNTLLLHLSIFHVLQSMELDVQFSLTAPKPPGAFRDLCSPYRAWARAGPLSHKKNKQARTWEYVGGLVLRTAHRPHQDFFLQSIRFPETSTRPGHDVFGVVLLRQ